MLESCPFGMKMEVQEEYVVLNPNAAFNPKTPAIVESELKAFILSWLKTCAREKKTGAVHCDRRYEWRGAEHAKVHFFLTVLEKVLDKKIHLRMMSAGIDDADASLLVKMIQKDRLASLSIQKNRLTERGERMLDEARQKAPCFVLDYRNGISER